MRKISNHVYFLANHLVLLHGLYHTKKLYMNTQIKSRENYLRVTNILYPFSGLQNIDPNIVSYAAERGTKVHKICEGIVLGIGEIGVDDETWGYVQSFKRWWERGIDVVTMEKRFRSQEK